MTLFEQWELVNYIANKDYEGNVIEPTRFAELVKIANLDLFKVKIGLPEDYQIGVPFSRQYLDANKTLTNETLFLKKRLPTQAVVAGVITYPNDYFRDNAIRYEYQRNIDGSPVIIPKTVQVLTEQQYSNRAGNYTKAPSTKNPIAVLRDDGIYIYPTSITSVDFTYIKYPTEPVFDYNVLTGYITEGAAPTEYEWPKILHMDLTRMILSYIGINLREQQLEAYAEQHKQQGF